MSVIISARFNGPPNSANGGYSCGRIAAQIGDSAEVTLRKPPPLDRELQLRAVDGQPPSWQLLDGELVIGSGHAAEPDVQIPAPPSVEDAARAEANFVGHQWHHFPTCFVCGTAREHGDGLRLFTGQLPHSPVVACTWTPHASVGCTDGSVDPAIVWSALDCPTFFAGRVAGYGLNAVLGRLTAHLLRPLAVGTRYAVVAWPIGIDGRKWEGGSAIFTAEGELCAYARGLWFELKQ